MTKHKRLQGFAAQSLTDEDCPSSIQLAAYAIGQLTGNEQLSVAAHARTCPLCRELLRVSTPVPSRVGAVDERDTPPLPIHAQLVPQFASGRQRSDSSRDQVRQYVAADIVIELTIPPPEGEAWSVIGQVLRSGAGLADCPISLSTSKRRPRLQNSDPDGFFSFTRLPAGAYRLQLSYQQVRVEIRDLQLQPSE